MGKGRNKSVAELKPGDKHPVTGRRIRKRGVRPRIEKEGPEDKVMSQPQFLAAEYHLQGYSKQQSMIKAGYAPVTATQPWRLFELPQMVKYLEKRREKMQLAGSRLEERVKEELAKLAFFNLGDVLRITEEGDLIYDFSEVTMDQMAAIGEVTVETYMEGKGKDAEEVKRLKVKPHDKKAALDSLARICGMFKDNTNITSNGQSLEERLQAGRQRLGQPVVIDVEPEEDD